MGRPIVQPITWYTWVEVVKIGRDDEPCLLVILCITVGIYSYGSFKYYRARSGENSNLTY